MVKDSGVWKDSGVVRNSQQCYAKGKGVTRSYR